MTSVADPRGERVADDVAAVRDDVRRGLAREQKELSPKYFYDRRGSELFEEITRLPEYYLTRAERALLERNVSAIVRSTGAATLVELGAGNADKTRLLLDAMRDAGTARAYVPIDVSEEFLAATAERLRAEYPSLEVRPLVADITAPLRLPRDLERPLLVAFLGSTIGNFERDQAIALLGNARRALRGDDHLLLGADLRKDIPTIERAYNDAAGVTAEFNRNMLSALNASLGADFDPSSFAHRAFYDRERHRMEMHLVADRPMTVHIPGIEPVSIARGESIHTEISCKYDRATLIELLGRAGLVMQRWITDEQNTFALVIAGPSD